MPSEADTGAPADNGRGRRGGGRAPKKRRRRSSGWLAGLLAVLVIVGGLGVVGNYGYRYLQAKYHPADFIGQGTGDVTVRVYSGDTAGSIAPQLLKLGVVASTRALILAAKAAPATPELEPGSFKLHRKMSAAAAWKLLVSGTTRLQKTVTLAEGLRVSRIVSILGEKTPLPTTAYQQAAKNVAALGLPSYADGHLEGYLFPATYNIQQGTTATQVLKAMVARFKLEASDLHLPEAAKAAQVSQNHIIIIASLIQAEGGRLSDFPKISEVIYNRLNRGAKLELDSTVEYALGKYGIAATDQQIQIPSAYNTYVHTGLPPGPIDSPGEAAIQAALHPARGKLFYFVTVDPKNQITKFTSSAAEFAKLRAELEANLAHGR